MQPTLFNFETDSEPVYYSLQNPGAFVFSPKSRKISSTLFELHELEHIMKVFQEELIKENTICSGTILGEAARNVKFSYYHNELDRHRIIKSSSDIAIEDKRFKYVAQKLKGKNSAFAADAKFLRGCISIKSTVS